MKKYLIERDIPGASKLSAEELQKIAKTSCKAANDLKVSYHWIQTYVTDDKFYCVHIAPSEEAIREHAEKGGFPVTRVYELATVIDAATAGV
jgi:hypothetical protein